MYKMLLVLVMVVGCGGPVGPYGVWTERPDTAMVDAGDAMDAAIHCEIADSFDVALLPGDECSSFTVPCSVPVKCPFAIAVARSKCVNGVCCHFVTGQNDVTYKDCGDGITPLADY